MSWKIIKQEMHRWLNILSFYENVHKLLQTSPRSRQNYKYCEQYLCLKELIGIIMTTACKQRYLDTALNLWT